MGGHFDRGNKRNPQLAINLRKSILNRFSAWTHDNNGRPRGGWVDVMFSFAGIPLNGGWIWGVFGGIQRVVGDLRFFGV